jgi:hypothetical protein
MRMADLFLSLHRILPDHVLYAHSAVELDEPRLLKLIRDGAPIYAWPYEDRHVWTMTNPRLIARMLARATRIRGP